MIKIYMAQPVADDMRTGKRSIHWLKVHGELTEEMKAFLSSGHDVWFDFILVDNGNKIWVNGKYIAWMEQLDESRQAS